MAYQTCNCAVKEGKMNTGELAIAIIKAYNCLKLKKETPQYERLNTLAPKTKHRNVFVSCFTHSQLQSATLPTRFIFSK